VNLVDNNTEEADKYVEQELRISKMQATMMEMENHLHMLMEQQQKQMEVTSKILLRKVMCISIYMLVCIFVHNT